jgi:hypothetical protein
MSEETAKGFGSADHSLRLSELVREQLSVYTLSVYIVGVS